MGATEERVFAHADRALVGPLKHGREFVEVRVEQSRFEDLQQDEGS
jgi:hypothetical protein